MNKKLLSVILTVCLVASIAPLGMMCVGAVDSGTFGNNLTWSLDGTGALVISKADVTLDDGSMNDFDSGGDAPWDSMKASIKSVAVGDGVAAIGSWAFHGCSNLESATIGNNVTKIGYYAFNECTKLEEINIPDCVTEFGIRAFGGCESLTEITIPEGITKIPNASFSRCINLASIDIPDSVNFIDSNAFSSCSGLKELVFGNGVNNIIYTAFSACYNLEKITIGAAMDSDDIGHIPLSDSKNLTEITVDPGNAYFSSDGGVLYSKDKTELKLFPRGRVGSYAISDIATAISKSAFSDCVELTNVTLSEDNQLTTIGDNAFYGCTKLTGIALQNAADTLTSIGTSAFYGCTNLTSITIPENVSSIGNNAFKSCTGLTEINYNSGKDINIPYDSGILDYAGTASTGITVTFGDSVNVIPCYLFEGAHLSEPDDITPKITNVIIGDNVTSISRDAFNQCTPLKTVTFGEDSSLEAIGQSAFWGCEGLTNLVIPDSVTSIGENAFTYCKGLTSITIGAGLDEADVKNFDYILSSDSALHSYDNLAEINVSEGNETYLAENNVLFKKDASGNKTELVRRPAKLAGVSYEIPYGVVSVNNSAFLNCRDLTSITIPDSVTSIGASAFSWCYNLENITIPNDVTSIGAGAFYGCYNLTNISIPDGITSIGDNTFSGCSHLASATIPDSITSFGENAFSSCTNLTNINIPDGVISIGNGAFSGCSGLTSITIPDSVMSIGGNAFNSCNNLTSVRVPDSVTSIGYGAFSSCSMLTDITVDESNPAYLSVDGILFNKDQTVLLCYPAGKSAASYAIPESVTSIGDWAFYGCSGLKYLTIRNSFTQIGQNVFSSYYDFTIIGHSFSTASAYAANHGINFITVGSTHELTFRYLLGERTYYESYEDAGSVITLPDGPNFFIIRCAGWKDVDTKTVYNVGDEYIVTKRSTFKPKYQTIFGYLWNKLFNK